MSLQMRIITKAKVYGVRCTVYGRLSEKLPIVLDSSQQLLYANLYVHSHSIPLTITFAVITVVFVVIYLLHVLSYCLQIIAVIMVNMNFYYTRIL